ncbi:uncharacterized protein LOC123530726 [Mercenaria mercenaria]|uniref:uncharacterized protein LOC123530726 n=1 Tax=Mercenaria mercenaria TaxID=6596 RepID=UPI00234ED067|nr:uncharacterized protein LOC123530726 [Mercenaria mercenaria]
MAMVVCFAAQNLKHKARKNYKLKAGYISEEIGTASYAQCLAYCSTRQGCISASYKSPSENCLLSEYDTIDDHWVSPGVPRGLEYAAGWTTMTRIRYPVFHVLGHYQRYSMTFAQAQQQCIDYGTTIATPSDLLEARSMGYEYCCCCWMSDETKGFVLQTYNPHCFSSFNEGILYCGWGTGDVWCKLK